MNKQVEKLAENLVEYEDYELLDEEAFCDSLIATTDDDRAVYDFDIMVEEYAKFHNVEPMEAADYISYNIVRGLKYYGSKAPIIIFPLR